MEPNSTVGNPVQILRENAEEKTEGTLVCTHQVGVGLVRAVFQILMRAVFQIPTRFFLVLKLIFSFLLIFSELSFGEVPISDPPKILFAPKKTGRKKVNVKGETCALCEVFVKVNEGGEITTKSDEHGLFEVEVDLEEQKENKITIYSRKSKRTSPISQIVILNQELPLPQPNAPPNVDRESIPKYTNSPGIKVFGRARPHSKVVVLGGSAKAEVFADEQGFFEILVFLKFDNLNEIEVYYEDEKGFLSPKATFEIYQISKAPPTPVVQKPSSYTNLDRIKIKGRTVPGFRVVVELPTGSKIESKADDESGAFELETYLIPNSENTIHVYTVDQAGNFSAAEKIVLFQDSIPPNPPEVIFYPSKAYQDRVTVIGKGEPDAKVVAYISERDYEVGRVDKAGNFVADVPILKFKKQIRRNYVNFYLEDNAGNISAPTLIVIDALPDIREKGIGLSVGVHSFLGIMARGFFDDLGKSPTDFAGLSVELKYLRLFQRGTGPAMMITGGFTTSFPRKVDIPQLQDPGVIVMGDAEALSRISLSTIYFIANIGVAFCFEDFEVFPSIGGGVLGFIKSGPVYSGGMIAKEDRLFFTYRLGTNIVAGYSLTETLKVYANSSFSFAPIGNVNERGSSVDAGGATLGVGMCFGF